MSRDERSGDPARPFGRDEPVSSSQHGSDRGAEREPRGQREARPSQPTGKHAQMVFMTPLGVPIGPSVEEELGIPDDLDDTLPPGDFPGQLLLDLGLR